MQFGSLYNDRFELFAVMNNAARVAGVNIGTPSVRTVSNGPVSYPPARWTASHVMKDNQAIFKDILHSSTRVLVNHGARVR